MTVCKALFLSVLVAIFVLPSCSGGGGATGMSENPGEVIATGTLSLTGPDTAVVGNTLSVGDVALVLGPGTVETYFFIDEGSSVSGFEYPVSAGITGSLVARDPENTFVINVIDAMEANGFVGISMSIRVMGMDFDYTCVPCSGLTIDPIARTVDFDNVQVVGQGLATGDLVIDGRIGWL